MSISISEKCKLVLYADDSAILFSHKDPGVIRNVLGTELENCNKWLIDNKLSLHLGKTECILFGSKKKLTKVENFNVHCNGQTIESQKSVKYLGSVLDNDLSATSIVTNIITKVNSRLKFLYRQNHCLNMNLRKVLCNSLIQCHFDYASSSWYSGLSKKLKNRLQVAQNKVIRFIFGYHSRTSLKFSEFSSLGWLNVENRVKQLRLNHVYIKNLTINAHLIYMIILSSHQIHILTVVDIVLTVFMFHRWMVLCQTHFSIKVSRTGTVFHKKLNL